MSVVIDVIADSVLACRNCGKPSCQCDKCAKIKGYSGLCSPCWAARTATVERTKADEENKPLEAKPTTKRGTAGFGSTGR